MPAVINLLSKMDVEEYEGFTQKSAAENGGMRIKTKEIKKTLQFMNTPVLTVEKSSALTEIKKENTAAIIVI